jgi:hypothetical protein
MRQPIGRLVAAVLGVVVAAAVGVVAFRPGGAPLSLPLPPALSSSRWLPLPLSMREGQTALAPPPLFADSFDGETPAPSRWQVTGASDVRLLRGDLLLRSSSEPDGAPAPPGWSRPGLYSAGALPARPGRTVVSVARPGLGAVRGPLFLLSPSPFPADATAGGYGVGFDSLGGDAGNGGANLRLTAVTPEGQFPYDSEVARPIDYLMATTLRPAGSLHFVSGGAFGTFPTATLIWVGDAGGAGDGGDLYVGVDARRTDAEAASVSVVDLPGDFTTSFGLARSADTFARPDADTLGRTEVGGFLWRRVAGDVRLAGGGLVRAGQDAAGAVFDPGVADGIFELDLKTPSGPYGGLSLYFRYRDEQNWWRFRCSSDSVDIVRSAGGTESVYYQTGTVGCAPGGAYHIVVRAHGPSVNVWLNGKGVTYSVGVLDESPATDGATSVGIGFGTGESSPVIDQVVVWPKTVTLPAAVGPAPGVPDGGERTVVEDTFGGNRPARLQNRRPDAGGPWREYNATWVAGEGRLVPTAATMADGSDLPTAPPAAALAAVSAGTTDMAATVAVDLPPALPGAAGEGVGPDDAWVGGPIVRFADGKGFVWARLVHSPQGDTIEVWESLDGTSRFLGSSDVTARLGAGGRHVLKLAALGQRVAAYVDGTLVLEGETAVLGGTWAGLLVTDDSLPVVFTAFRATGARPDTVPPPPVLDLDAPASAAPAPTLTWPPAGDDASGTRYYRVYRSTTPGLLGAQINADGETTGTTYTDARPPGAGTYCYTVAGVDGAGNVDPRGSGQRCVVSGPAGVTTR